MTPEERKQGESEIFREYQEALACLEILHHRISEIGDALYLVRHGLKHSHGVNESSLSTLETLRGVLEDYERTHIRCSTLYQSLKRLGLEEIIKAVPHPEIKFAR